MKGFTAFMKKELLEAVRSYKLVILLIVFAALGFMNPVSALHTDVSVVRQCPVFAMLPATASTPPHT